MEVKDVADLFIASTGRIAFYWNFYVVTLMALIGWLISTKNPLPRHAKPLVGIGYLAFVAMNISGLWASYALSDALRLDLLSMDSAALMTETYAALDGYSALSYMPVMTLGIHAVLGAVFFYTLWRVPPSEQRDAPAVAG